MIAVASCLIVVSGGTAGNVVAGRLAENPNITVLVIEAGVGYALPLSPSVMILTYRQQPQRDRYDQHSRPHLRATQQRLRLGVQNHHD